jgi:hypothetical protein
MCILKTALIEPKASVLSKRSKTSKQAKKKQATLSYTRYMVDG